MSKSLKNITKLITSNISAKLINIVSLMFYTRYLSKQEMAIFPIYIMFTGLPSLIFSFGMLPVFIRELPSLFKKDFEKARSIIFTALFVMLLGSLFSVFFVVIFANPLSSFLFKNKLLSNLLKIMSISFIFTVFQHIATYIMWARAQFGQIALCQFFYALTRPIVIIPLFFIWGVKGLVSGLLINSFFHVCLKVYFTKDIFLEKKLRFYPVLKLLKRSFPFYLESYLMYFRREGDNWVISTMLGPKSLATYYIAKTIYNIFLIIYDSIDKVVTERLAYFRLNSQELQALFNKILKILIMCIVPLIAFVVALLPSIINILAGKKYSDAFYPSLLLLCTLLIYFLRIPFSRSIFVNFSPYVRLKITIVQVIVLFPLLIYLTSFAGPSGAAFARIVSQVAGIIFEYCFLSNIFDVYFYHFIKRFFISFFVVFPGTLLVLILQIKKFSLKYLPFYPLIWLSSFFLLVFLLDKELLRLISSFRLTIMEKLVFYKTK